MPRNISATGECQSVYILRCEKGVCLRRLDRTPVLGLWLAPSIRPYSITLREQCNPYYSEPSFITELRLYLADRTVIPDVGGNRVGKSLRVLALSYFLETACTLHARSWGLIVSRQRRTENRLRWCQGHARRAICNCSGF